MRVHGRVPGSFDLITMPNRKPHSEWLDEIAVAIEDLRAKLSIARCQICDDYLGRDPLNPPAVFERELVHQGCAEKASLGR